MTDTTMMNTADGGASSSFGPSTPLLIFQPYNMISFLSFFSPIILATLILSSSFFFQNVKGLLYLLFLMIVTTLRSFVLQAGGATKNKQGDCGFVQYGAYGNATFTTFVFAFTIMYLFLPMYQNDSTNWILIIVMLIYVFIDIGIKLLQGCIKMPEGTTDIVGDLTGGSLLGAIVVSLMNLAGNAKYLFFTDNTQNGTSCSMPKKQTFKCQVFRNGELVSSTTT
jgi:hypothetical protein